MHVYVLVCLASCFGRFKHLLPPNYPLLFHRRHPRSMAIHESILPALFHTIELCLGPSVFMLMMSFAIFVKAPSSTFVNAMQHFGT